MHFAREIHEIYFCFVDFDSELFRFGAALQHPRKRFRRVNIRLFEVTSRVPRERTVHTLVFRLRRGSIDTGIDTVKYVGRSLLLPITVSDSERSIDLVAVPSYSR